MIYLLRHRDTAACETAARAQVLEAQGYTRCSRAAFRAAWRERDMAALAAMHEALPELERAVGETVMSPNGFRIFKV